MLLVSHLHRLLASDCGNNSADAPHAAFLHPNATPKMEPRRSIEVRAFVFTYAETISPKKTDGQG